MEALDIDAETDALDIDLPPRTTLQTATEVLARYGDILRIRPAGEQQRDGEQKGGAISKVSVVFFDVRAATRAVKALGSSHLCEVMPQVALRTVSFPRELRLDAFCLEGVSDMWDSPGDEDSFSVEFFDSRDALCVALRARQQSCLISWPDGSEEERWGRPTPLPGDDFHSDAASDGGEGSAAAAEVDYSACMSAAHAIVCLQGLPNALCTPSMIQAVLQQAGLARSVVGGRVRQGAPCGEALVTLANRQAAEVCAKHFQGHGWDASGTLVSALLVSPPASWGSSDCPPSPALIQSLASQAQVAQDGGGSSVAPPPPGRRGRSFRTGFWATTGDEESVVSSQRLRSGDPSAGKVGGLISDESTDCGSSGCDTQVASSSRGSRRSNQAGCSPSVQFPELPGRSTHAHTAAPCAAGGVSSSPELPSRAPSELIEEGHLPSRTDPREGPPPEWAAAAAAAATENLLKILVWE